MAADAEKRAVPVPVRAAERIRPGDGRSRYNQSMRSAPGSMGWFVVRRTLLGVLTIILVPALSFLFWSAQIEDGPWTLGGDSPSLLGRLWTYLGDTFIRFDLGRAVTLGAVPVSQTIREGLPVDLALVAGALVIGTLTGLAGGLACARRNQSRLARGLRSVALLALCVPVYGAALIVLTLVSSNTGHLALPFVSGSGQYVPLHEDPLGWLRAMWVPWLILAAPIAAPCLRLTEVLLREHRDEPFVRTALAKGLSEQVVLRRHVLPAAAPPVVAFVGASTGVLVLNVALVEVVFSLDGSFHNLQSAITRLDLPLVQGMVIVATVLVVLGGAVADGVLLAMERRVRG
jgi:peptide/nickel transport system permease protein